MLLQNSIGSQYGGMTVLITIAWRWRALVISLVIACACWMSPLTESTSYASEQQLAPAHYDHKLEPMPRQYVLHAQIFILLIIHIVGIYRLIAILHMRRFLLWSRFWDVAKHKLRLLLRPLQFTSSYVIRYRSTF